MHNNEEQQQPAVAMLFCKRDIVQPYHVMRKQSLVIGRDNPLNIASTSYDNEPVDVDLCPFTHFVSRKHFRIRHCFDAGTGRNCFIGDVLGKNGVFVDGEFYRSGISIELPPKCFLRFPSTDICISFISLLHGDFHNGNSNSQPTELLTLANDFFECMSDTDKNNRICTPRPCSPNGTISAFNSCPPSPGRNQQQQVQPISIVPLLSSSPLPNDDKRHKKLCINVLPSDDTLYEDIDFSFEQTNPTIDRDDVVGDVAVTSSANLVLDFHNSDAQMPPLYDDSTNQDHFLQSAIVVPDNFTSAVGPGCIDLEQEDRIVTPENTFPEPVTELEPPVDTTKPALSYVQLIVEALLSSPTHRLPLKRICEYISKRHPHYRLSEKGWQNCVRHTLSVSPYFANKADRLPGSRDITYLWVFTEKYHMSTRQGPVRRTRTKKVPAPPPLKHKPKPIAPAPLPPPVQQAPPAQAMPVTFLSSAQTMPMVQPVTILFSGGHNGIGSYGTVLPQPQSQPQVIYLQCVQPTADTYYSSSTPFSVIGQTPQPLPSYQNITVTAAPSTSQQSTTGTAVKSVMANDGNVIFPPFSPFSTSFSSCFPKV